MLIIFVYLYMYNKNIVYIYIYRDGTQCSITFEPRDTNDIIEWFGLPIVSQLFFKEGTSPQQSAAGPSARCFHWETFLPSVVRPLNSKSCIYKCMYNLHDSFQTQDMSRMHETYSTCKSGQSSLFHSPRYSSQIRALSGRQGKQVHQEVASISVFKASCPKLFR